MGMAGQLKPLMDSRIHSLRCSWLTMDYNDHDELHTSTFTPWTFNSSYNDMSINELLLSSHVFSCFPTASLPHYVNGMGHTQSQMEHMPLNSGVVGISDHKFLV